MYKIARFLISGTTAAVVNLLLLAFFVEHAGIHYLTASILSFFGSLGVSFTLQKFWTFKSHAIRGSHQEFMRYTAITLTNLVINTSLMYLFVSILGWWYIAAQIVAGMVIAVTGYAGYSLVFARSAADSSRPEGQL
jgi:putative flippase GtrA